MSGILISEFWRPKKKDHVCKRPLQSTDFIFPKTFENFSHGVFGLVGSSLSVIIKRKRIGRGGIDNAHL